MHLAVDESWRDRTVFEILPLFSIAISLKRIADQGEPVNVKAEAEPTIANDIDWLGSQHRRLNITPPSTLVEVELAKGGTARSLLGDAIDWASPEDARRLKGTFTRWRLLY